MKYEFVAKASGDGECFCFLVDKETYIRICGEQKYKDELKYLEEFNDDLSGPLPFVEPTAWPVYPNEFFQSGANLSIKIETTEI